MARLLRARHHLRRRFSRMDVRLGIRLACSAVLAMVAGKFLGLNAFYWAGISAIVVSTGTPGGSFAASLARCGGSVVGLAVGFLSVMLLGHSFAAAALGIILSILVCQVSGLRTALKVAALSTLFPISVAADAHGYTVSLSMVLTRMENVLLGCAMTLLIDGLVWPERSSTKLQGLLRRDVAKAGRIAGGLLLAYAENRPSVSVTQLPELQSGRLAYAGLIQELANEPDNPAAPESLLERQAESVHLLVDHCAALRDIQTQTREDRAQALLGDEIRALAAAFRDSAAAFGKNEATFPEHLDALRTAGIRLEAAYEGVRSETQAFPPQETFRLLGVLYLCGALVRAMGELEAGPGPEELMVAEG